MRKLLYLLLIVAVGYGLYWYLFKRGGSGPSGPKMAPLTLKKHSEQFNAGVDSALNAYLGARDAFVQGDTVMVKRRIQELISRLDSLPVDELKKDTVVILQTVKANIADVQANAASLLQQTDITEMRRDFGMVTEMLFPSFFKAINYEGGKIYLIRYEHAFGENQGANWLSDTTLVINPYMGVNHPQYGDKKLHEGEVKDSIVSPR